MYKNITGYVLEKMRQQWKTCRKSFLDICHKGEGYLTLEELKHALLNWDIHVTEVQLKDVYQALDNDKDGMVSYGDF